MDELEDVLREEGGRLMNRSPGLHMHKSFERQFRALFGMPPSILALAWEEIVDSLPPQRKPKHLLWSCLFLKVYGTETVHCAIVRVDPKTFRLWSWTIISKLASARVISWTLRTFSSISADDGKYLCYATVGCTDCTILEPYPFEEGWCSHKTNSACVRYEVSVSISGETVWVNGPYKAGANPDLSIFRKELRQMLFENEIIACDATYTDLKCVFDDGFEENLGQVLRARQESLFSRMKYFNVLSHKFRHSLKRH